ncbi:Protein Wnt-1 [Gryllus bimaculatus]|nr:Protein Wnt-1 [Gryllus bimaculatus]
MNNQCILLLVVLMLALVGGRYRESRSGARPSPAAGVGKRGARVRLGRLSPARCDRTARAPPPPAAALPGGGGGRGAGGRSGGAAGARAHHRAPRAPPPPPPGAAAAAAWKWGGCSHNMDYGLKFSKMFLDSRERAGDMQARVNLHNNQAGRLAVASNVQPRCKCHGVSGSCELKTCWEAAPPFRAVGAALKERFRAAVLVDQGNLGRPGAPLLAAAPPAGPSPHIVIAYVVIVELTGLYKTFLSIASLVNKSKLVTTWRLFLTSGKAMMSNIYQIICQILGNLLVIRFWHSEELSKVHCLSLLKIISYFHLLQRNLIDLYRHGHNYPHYFWFLMNLRHKDDCQINNHRESQLLFFLSAYSRRKHYFDSYILARNIDKFICLSHMYLPTFIPVLRKSCFIEFFKIRSKIFCKRTAGRRCHRGSRGADGCASMCCGRGYDERRERRDERCNCRFRWCCSVTCDNCTIEEWVTVCKETSAKMKRSSTRKGNNDEEEEEEQEERIKLINAF